MLSTSRGLAGTDSVVVEIHASARLDLEYIRKIVVYVRIAQRVFVGGFRLTRFLSRDLSDSEFDRVPPCSLGRCGVNSLNFRGLSARAPVGRVAVKRVYDLVLRIDVAAVIGGVCLVAWVLRFHVEYQSVYVRVNLQVVSLSRRHHAHRHLSALRTVTEVSVSVGIRTEGGVSLRDSHSCRVLLSVGSIR